VLTNNFDPEYGNYNGGMVTVVSKSGSNAFHGTANFVPFAADPFFYYRNRVSYNRAAGGITAHTALNAHLPQRKTGT
jgi:hypothetical protein